MKALLPAVLLTAIAVFIVAQNPTGEQAPPGSLEKIVAAVPTKSFAEPKSKRQVLVFSRTNGFRHASIATGKIALEELGKRTGAFEVTISDDLANFEAEALNKFDAVCFLNTTMNVFAPNKEEIKSLSETDKATAAERETRLKANLMSYVKSGKGFIGIHAATDTFYEWDEYMKMINGAFDGHPWNAGDKVSIKVEPGQEKHPIAAMFNGQNLEFNEEIYQFKTPYDSKSVQMLLRLDVEKTNMKVEGIKRTDGDYGVAWVRNWEKGRVFYCSIGHNHEMYWNPLILSHYLAGIQWALGDYQVEVPH